jgi:hypothetical protein
MRSGLGSIGADSPHNGRAYGANGEAEHGPAQQSVQELLALVEAERNKMSKAVLSSADGLSSAVTMARKRLAANIAAVEEQLREEKRMLELARGELPLTASCASTAELQAILHARDIELETLRRDKHALEEEKEDLKKEIAALKKELMSSKQRTTAAVESSAALQAEVAVLRSSLKGTETLALPTPVPGSHPAVSLLLAFHEQTLRACAPAQPHSARLEPSDWALRMRELVVPPRARSARWIERCIGTCAMQRSSCPIRQRSSRGARWSRKW